MWTKQNHKAFLRSSSSSTFRQFRNPQNPRSNAATTVSRFSVVENFRSLFRNSNICYFSFLSLWFRLQFLGFLCFWFGISEMGSRKEEERNEKIIRGLMKLPPNRRCINCNSLVNSTFLFDFYLIFFFFFFGLVKVCFSFITFFFYVWGFWVLWIIRSLKTLRSLRRWSGDSCLELRRVENVWRIWGRDFNF